jgi:hypothetical protein
MVALVVYSIYTASIIYTSPHSFHYLHGQPVLSTTRADFISFIIPPELPPHYPLPHQQPQHVTPKF